MSDEVVCRGCSIKEIHRNLSEWELKHAHPIRPSDNHAVLYHWPHINFNELPQPQKGHNKWDAFHVRLPCSPKSQYPVTQSDGSIEIENRWSMIKKALSKPIRNSQELETVILSYNSKYQNIWKFRALHKLFEEELEEEEALMFFDDLLPKVIQLALSLPEIITSPIPLLKQGQNRSISMSQQQVACLLANAFLCTFPRRNTTKKKSEYSSFPDINFNRLFQSSGQQVLEKIKCICHYFRRVCDKMPTGILTFIRRSLSDSELPKWDECDMKLGVTSFHITSSGTIENQGQGLLQVDFANKFLGGGVLGSGCVQEEIRFVICPELIISKLFTEALKPFEALLMIGCEQFSKYKGYASTFTWDGNYEDKTPTDDSGRRQCHIVAIDALYFVQSSHQYREELIMRELNKAYVGFVHTLNSPAPGVASGNWGCGAFGGEASLKALIQLMACTVTRRPLVYFTFGNKELRDDVYNMYNFFKENNITVKQLWKYLREFHDHKLSPCDLYSFIIQIHRDNQQVNKSNSLKSNLETLTLSMEATLKTPRNTTKTINHISNTSKVGSALRARSNDSVFRKNIWQKNVNLEETKKCFKNIDHHKIKTEDKIKETKNNSITSPTKQGELFKSIISPRECTSGINEKDSTKSSFKFNKTQSNTSEKLKSPVKNSKGKDLKQRSLLDMLDVFYTGERSAKRLCIPHQQKK